MKNIKTLFLVLTFSSLANKEHLYLFCLFAPLEYFYAQPVVNLGQQPAGAKYLLCVG